MTCFNFESLNKVSPLCCFGIVSIGDTEWAGPKSGVRSFASLLLGIDSELPNPIYACLPFKPHPYIMCLQMPFKYQLAHKNSYDW